MNDIINLTKEASSFVKNNLLQTKEAFGLRLGVKSYGCSGLGYVVDYASKQELTENDLVFESEGVTLVIDQESLPYLKGAKLDCITEGLNKTLKIISNPNATGGCGCGESFSVEG